MKLIVVPIHKHPEYLQDCCNLINAEWKRSDTARLHSLQSSCDQLPTSLILLHNNLLIGHLKLSIIPSLKNACFIESVVIDKKVRGNGYGKFIMQEAEKYVKEFLCLDTIYLSTKGQELFYQKLGYNECYPISIYGSFVPKKTSLTTVKVNNINQNVPPPPALPPTCNNFNTKTYMKKEVSKFY